jgi:hypothetical protein
LPIEEREETIEVKAMKWKDAAVSLGAIGVITTLGLWAFLSVSRPPADLCRVCERGLHKGVTYRIELEQATEDACCPRCGMHYQFEHPGAAKKAWATDLNSGKFIPAGSAYYVEGGDIEYCTLHSTPVARQPQGVSVRDYDRCLPSLVAFGTRLDAEAYQQLHGGQVRTYAEAMESVRER